MRYTNVHKCTLAVLLSTSTNILALAEPTSHLVPVVDLGYAAYVGNSTSPAGVANSSVTFFGGIPYVQPPLGNLRFQVPKQLNESLNSVRTVVDARGWGPTCIQQPAVEGVAAEDCLNLNIWKPTSAKPSAKLPVVIYIHRGGFFYRFGGDPTDNSISGESSGGMSVVLQATAYGLFPLPLDTEIEGVFKTVTTAAGCPLDGREPMSCLRATPLSTLIKSINSVRTNFLAANLDGPDGFLPDFPSKMIAQGRFSRGVDLIAGHTTNDGQNFAGNPATLNTDADVVAVTLRRSRYMTNATLEKVLELYPSPNVPGSPFATQYDRTWTIMQETVFACMDQHWANATLKRGGRNVYSYRFNVPNPVVQAMNPYMGAMHASDVYYMFNGATGAAPSFRPLNTTQAPVSQEIIAYWTSFTRSGKPSAFKRPGSPEWPNFLGGKRVVMSEEIRGNGSSFVESIPTLESTRCQWWMSQNETRV